MNYPLWLTVTVSLMDIFEGCHRNGMQCPIANALKRMGYQHFSVNDFKISFADGAEYATSSAAREFIWQFDTGYNVHSTQFTFRRTSLPHPVQEPQHVGMEVIGG